MDCAHKKSGRGQLCSHWIEQQSRLGWDICLRRFRFIHDLGSFCMPSRVYRAVYDKVCEDVFFVSGRSNLTTSAVAARTEDSSCRRCRPSFGRLPPRHTHLRFLICISCFISLIERSCKQISDSKPPIFLPGLKRTDSL